MTIVKKCISITAIVVLLFVSIPTIHAVEKTLNVTPAQQEKTKWCWAATAQMTGKFVYPSSTATQTQIVIHVKGSNINSGATIYETANGTMYATNDTITFAAALAPFEFELVKEYIDANLPIQPLVHKTYSDGTKSGHYYVIRGYSKTTYSSYLYLIDPWDGSGKFVSYDNFLNGTWSETRPWVSSTA